MQPVKTTFKAVTLEHNGVTFTRIDKYKDGVFSTVDHYECNCNSFDTEDEAKSWIDEVFAV